MKLDFHIHSTFSDGSSKVEEIFQIAKDKRMMALSITDHDTILGLKKVEKLSEKYRIPFVSGVEFTAVENNIKFHVLAYDIDINSLELEEYSQNLLEYLNQISIKQIKQLQETGIIIEEKEFFKESQGGPLYRAKLLKTLSNHGYIKEDIMSSLSLYFGKDGPCYVENNYKYNDFEQTCKLIKRNGGLVVLAHPGKIKNKDLALYNNLINSNLIDGLEIYHLSNGLDVRKELKDIAVNKDLLFTGGSDYHGLYNKRKTSIGDVDIPYEVYQSLYPYLKNKN